MKQLGHFQFPGKLDSKEGRVIPRSPRYVKGLLQTYEPCDVIVHIERRKRGRSNRQNAYYWGVVLPEISVHTGHSVEELHEIFKAKYLGAKHLWRGAELKTVRSTSDLTSNEFAEFLTSVILEANELGIEVPQPDQAYQFKS